MNNFAQQSWWFENQYGKSFITINIKTITINHKGLTTFSLKKQRDNVIIINNIKQVILKKPTFWQCGYLYLVLHDSVAKTNDEQILLSNTCIALKWKSEFKEAQAIKSIINNLIT